MSEMRSIGCENTLLVLKENVRREGTVEKWTFIFGIVWKSTVSIYFLF